MQQQSRKDDRIGMVALARISVMTQTTTLGYGVESAARVRDGCEIVTITEMSRTLLPQG